MIKRRAAGFTLIELLVAVTISGIILSGVMSSYAGFIRTKQQIDLHRQLQTQTSIAMSRIADKVRDYGIDYASDTKVRSENILPVGQGVQFVIEDEQLIMSQNGVHARMFGEAITVRGTFEITPGPEQFDERLRLNQPKVHVQIQMTHKQDPSVTLELQTTLSSRRY